MTSLAERLRPAVVHPLGRFLQTVHDPPAPPTHRVRTWGGIEVLDDAELRTWVLARELPGRPPGTPVTRSDLAAHAPGDPGLVDRLLARGLLTELVPGGAAAEQLARRTALVLLVPGLGNTSAQPTVFSLGLPGRPLASVSRTVFDLLVRGRLHRDLWAACTASAEAAVALGSTAAADRSPERVLAQVLEALPVLLATDAAFLDARPAR